MAPKMTTIVATAMLVFVVGANASGIVSPRRQLQDSGSCVVTGAAAGSGDCTTNGCCDTLVECSPNGTCDVTEAVCTPGSCSGDQICAEKAECVELTEVAFVPDLSDSTVLGTVTYQGSEITLTGSSDGSSIVEASLYSDVLGATVHFEWDSGKGRPIFASVEGVDEVLVLGYDDDGNLVDAVEDTGVRRHLEESRSKMSPTDSRVTRKLQFSACIAACDAITDSFLSSGATFCAVPQCALSLAQCAVLEAVCLLLIALAALASEQACYSACIPEVTDDPHMFGLLGQRIDWKGEAGNWYALVHDGVEKQIAVRLTSPLPEEFPDRQLVTGVSLVSTGGHSLIIEADNPYTTETAGCPPDMMVPCLAEGSLRITVDGEQTNFLVSPSEKIELPGGITVSAANLPAECQPFGGDLEWASTFEKMTPGRRLYVDNSVSFVDFVKSTSKTTAAPMWCEKFLNEQGTEGLLYHSSKHVVFNVESPHFSFRLHHGTNHQGGEVIPDGRVLPELEFWQMNFYLNWADVNYSTVTGVLGQTARPVFDKVTGVRIMNGLEALGAEVEDFRLSGPISTEFPQLSK